MADVPGPIYTTGYRSHPTDTMKAAKWMATQTIEIGEAPKPVVTAPKDAIVRITHCTICGSDLHMYAGLLNMAMQKGDIMGHEAIGIVEDVGPDVETVKVGDRVVILAVIPCGECEYCARKEYSLCDNSNPSKEMEKMWGHRTSGIFGYTHLTGGYAGNQAEYCRVPNADLVCVTVPKDIAPQKILPLADVVPTSWHGCELAEVRKGDIIGVWGCGPIGLTIQRLAKEIRGAAKVYAVDKDPERLAIAERFGMIPIDVSKHSNPADYILSLEPRGLDRSIEASGFRSTNSMLHTAMRTVGLETDSADTVSACIKATRKGGNVALIGDFFFTTNGFPIGTLMEKTITLRGGQLMAQKYYPFLRDLVVDGKFDPSFVFTHEDILENIADQYKKQYNHEIAGGLKVLLVTPYARSNAK